MSAAFWGNAAHEGPTFALDPWDLVTIGDPLPGVCEVKGIAQLELDKKKQKGTNGLTLTVTGYQPSPFEVSVVTWTEEQKEFLEAWIEKWWLTPRRERPQFVATKKKDGTTVRTKNRAPMVAVDIDHPALQMLGIISCTIQGISIPEAGPFEGSKIIKIKVVEHVAPDGKNVVKTAKGSATNVRLATRLQPKAKAETPEPPSSDRKQLGPDGPPSAAAGGSD